MANKYDNILLCLVPFFSALSSFTFWNLKSIQTMLSHYCGLIFAYYKQLPTSLH